jgi:uncharacterized membrane protein YdcZ (DUF606 family)
MQHSEALGVVLGANLCNILSRLELFIVSWLSGKTKPPAHLFLVKAVLCISWDDGIFGKYFVFTETLI